MKGLDIGEIFAMLITAGVTLTFVAIVFQDPQGTGQVLNAGAGAFRTTFGTFLKGTPTGNVA